MAGQPPAFEAWSANTAEERARSLLREHLTDEEWKIYDAEGYLDVTAKSGRRFRLVRFPGHTAVAVYEHGTYHRYCIGFPFTHPSPSLNTVPPSDTVLALTLMLRYDEATFHRTANDLGFEFSDATIGMGLSADINERLRRRDGVRTIGEMQAELDALLARHRRCRGFWSTCVRDFLTLPAFCWLMVVCMAFSMVEIAGVFTAALAVLGVLGVMFLVCVMFAREERRR